MRTRDEKLLKLAHQYVATASGSTPKRGRTLRMIQGKAVRVIAQSTDSLDLRSELIQEWQDLCDTLLKN